MKTFRTVVPAAIMAAAFTVGGSALAFDQKDLIKPIDKKLTFVVIPKVIHPWYEVAAAGGEFAVEELKEQGIEVEVIWDSPPQADVADHNRRIETNIGRAPDGLAISCLDASTNNQLIDEAVEAASARNWAQLHNRIGNMYRATNPDLPTLQPWHNKVSPPATRFVAKRNAYYHRIDAAGQQLPYADRFIMDVVNGSLVPAKTSAGEADLQSRSLNFSDYTFLKAGEERSDYDVRLWKTVRGSQLALYPNLNASDPVWRELNRDARFRQALSLGINRSEINQVIYYGLCLEGNNSVLPDSPLYKDEYRQAYAEFAPEKANALLDDLGLTERNGQGIRLLPDGRPLEIIVETAGENTEEVDVLELIGDSWKQIGVKLFTKPSQRDVLRNRIFSGETVMAMWYGYENGIPTSYSSPEEFVPVHQQSYHWPMWGQYAETNGNAGEPVDMEKPKRLMELYKSWIAAKSRGEKEAAWREILEIHAEEVYTIGLIAEVPQPVVVANSLRNVPEKGIYNWDPGAQFGMYRPERFWFDR